MNHKEIWFGDMVQTKVQLRALVTVLMTVPRMSWLSDNYEHLRTDHGARIKKKTFFPYIGVTSFYRT